MAETAVNLRPTPAEIEAVPVKLRTWNLVVGLVHLVQAIAIAAISNDFKLPITGQYLAGPPGTDIGPPDLIWSVPVGYAVAFFLFLASLDHLLMAAPGGWEWYRRNLADKINYARWTEYSISASVMIVLIALVTGVSDVGAIVAIFGVNASMIMFGLVMEMMNHRRRDDEPVNWMPFICGSIAGIVPWIIIAIQIGGAEENAVDGEGVPTFVYAIIVSLFILFNSFAINMALQYGKISRWRNYLFGEKGYIILSLTAKSLLAWQVFANTLID